MRVEKLNARWDHGRPVQVVRMSSGDKFGSYTWCYKHHSSAHEQWQHCGIQGVHVHKVRMSRNSTVGFGA